MHTSLGRVEEMPSSPTAPSHSIHGLTLTPFLLLFMCLVTPPNPCFVPAFPSLNFFSFHFSLCPIFQFHQFAVSEVSEPSNTTTFRGKKQLLYKGMSGMAQNYRGSSCVPPMISSIVIQHNSLHGNQVQTSALIQRFFKFHQL